MGWCLSCKEEPAECRSCGCCLYCCDCDDDEEEEYGDDDDDEGPLGRFPSRSHPRAAVR
jgi:hypothetical protein